MIITEGQGTEGNSLDAGFYSKSKNVETLKQQFREHIKLRHKKSKTKRLYCNIVDMA
jgi:hypothetical protein